MQRAFRTEVLRSFRKIRPIASPDRCSVRSDGFAAGPSYRGGNLQRINCNLLMEKLKNNKESDLRMLPHCTYTSSFPSADTTVKFASLCFDDRNCLYSLFSTMGHHLHFL